MAQRPFWVVERNVRGSSTWTPTTVPVRNKKFAEQEYTLLKKVIPMADLRLTKFVRLP